MVNCKTSRPRPPGQAASIEELAARVSDIASELAKLAPETHPVFLNNSPGGELASFARILIQERKHRNSLFGADYFSEPAWDMMLDLFVAAEEKKKVSVSSLCIASQVPPTTALRWLTSLVEGGIFERRPDHQDGRRIWIEMPMAIQIRMRSLLMSWQINRDRWLRER